MADSISVERSQCPRYKITHLLRIENVQSRIAKKERFDSLPFSCAEESKPTEFVVFVYFGKREKDWLSVFLETVDREVYVIKASLRVLDTHLNELNVESIRKRLFKSLEGRGNSKLLDLKNASFPDDTLCVRCEIEFLGAPKSDGVISLLPRDPKLHSDLLALRNDTNDTDVTIIVAGKKFRAHKALLRARSDYFRALYDSGLEESRTNEVGKRSEPISPTKPDYNFYVLVNSIVKCNV